MNGSPLLGSKGKGCIESIDTTIFYAHFILPIFMLFAIFNSFFSTFDSLHLLQLSLVLALVLNM